MQHIANKHNATHCIETQCNALHSNTMQDIANKQIA